MRSFKAATIVIPLLLPMTSQASDDVKCLALQNTERSCIFPLQAERSGGVILFSSKKKNNECRDYQDTVIMMAHVYCTATNAGDFWKAETSPNFGGIEYTCGDSTSLKSKKKRLRSLVWDGAVNKSVKIELPKFRGKKSLGFAKFICRPV